MSPKDLMEELDRERQRQGITASELCERAGVTNSSYSRWKNGINSPTLECVALICDALGMRIGLDKG